MNLFLCVVDEHRWQGLVEIDGETFKVILFPGSATKDWEAVLMDGGWVELSDDSKLTQAVVTAYTSLQQRGEQPIPKSQEQFILEALQADPNLLDEILAAISMEEIQEDLTE